jgi:hypothetical protein
MSKFITVIQFAKLVDKAPQQIYGAIQRKSFPKELISYEAKAAGGHQPMLDSEAAFSWFQAKESARLGKAVTSVIANVYTVDQLLIDLAAGDKKGLVTQIKKFIEVKN